MSVKTNLRQSCYQGVFEAKLGQDFFLKAEAKDMKIFQGQDFSQGQGQGHKKFFKANIKVNWDSYHYELKFALQ